MSSSQPSLSHDSSPASLASVHVGSSSPRSSSRVAPLWDVVACEPLDYSFKELVLLDGTCALPSRDASLTPQTDVLGEEARHTRSGIAPPIVSTHDPQDKSLRATPVEVVRLGPARGASPKRSPVLRVEALRLCNNRFTTLVSLPRVATTLLHNIQHLKWLDVSFNLLDKIEPSLGELVSLSHLYLHANNLNNIQELAHIAHLAHLRALTLHGNPLTDHRDYKSTILSYLPKLKHLDFGAITKSDKASAKRRVLSYERKKSSSAQRNL